MAWEVEYTDEFGDWWESLKEAEQIDVAAHVCELERRGPMLPFPYSSDVKAAKHGAIEGTAGSEWRETRKSLLCF